MRIGMITGEYPPMQGGVGDYTRVLAGTLVAAGHEVAIFTDHRGRQVDPGIQVDAIAHHWGVAVMRAADRWAAHNRLDVVNLQYQTAAFGMSPWLHALPDLLKSAPLITTFHDLRPPYVFPKAGRLRQALVLRLARRSRAAVVTNHEDAAQLTGLPRMALVPIGSNIVARPPRPFDAQRWREKAGAAPDDVLLAYFGLINRSKGLETLLDALAALRAGGLSARLVMIGGRVGASDATNAAYAAEIDARIARLGLESDVHWTGFLDDLEVAAFLKAADAVVLPFADGASYRRGSLMAAIHQGCPIVTTIPRVSVPDFRDGDNLLLVEPGAAATLAQAVHRLCMTPELNRRLRFGAAQLAERFAWPEIATQLVTFFQQSIS